MKVIRVTISFLFFEIELKQDSSRDNSTSVIPQTHIASLKKKDIRERPHQRLAKCTTM